MRYVSLFSGIEAASVAWEPLGFEPMAFAEIEPFPCAVLAHRWPDVPNLGDVMKVDWGDFLATSGKPDVVVGGSPCQSFSVAGKREGLAGASGLMWEYVRAIQELRPRWLVWENVPGALSSSHGEDFGCLLRSLDDLGYGLAWRVLDAEFFGVAQRRRRVFLVGHLGDDSAGGVLLEPEGLSGDHPSSREKRSQLAAAAGRGAQAAGGPAYAIRTANTSSNGWGVQEGVAHTVDCAGPEAVAFAQNQRDEVRLVGGDGSLAGSVEARPGKNRTYVMTQAVRRITPLEAERLMGFPDGHTDIPYKGKEHPPDTPRYRALGNSMAVPVMRWVGERIRQADLPDGTTERTRGEHA